MKEAIKIILSAWSTGLIILFLILTGAINSGSRVDEGTAFLWMFLLFGSITGTGWLIYRSETKN